MGIWTSSVVKCDGCGRTERREVRGDEVVWDGWCKLEPVDLFAQGFVFRQAVEDSVYVCSWECCQAWAKGHLRPLTSTGGEAWLTRPVVWGDSVSVRVADL